MATAIIPCTNPCGSGSAPYDCANGAEVNPDIAASLHCTGGAIPWSCGCKNLVSGDITEHFFCQPPPSACGEGSAGGSSLLVPVLGVSAIAGALGFVYWRDRRTGTSTLHRSEAQLSRVLRR